MKGKLCLHKASEKLVIFFILCLTYPISIIHSYLILNPVTITAYQEYCINTFSLGLLNTLFVISYQMAASHYLVVHYFYWILCGFDVADWVGSSLPFLFQLAPYRFISMIQFWGRLWPKIPIYIMWVQPRKKESIETFKPLINNGESTATGLSKKEKSAHKGKTHLSTVEFRLVRGDME